MLFNTRIFAVNSSDFLVYLNRGYLILLFCNKNNWETSNFNFNKATNEHQHKSPKVLSFILAFLPFWSTLRQKVCYNILGAALEGLVCQVSCFPFPLFSANKQLSAT